MVAGDHQLVLVRERVEPRGKVLELLQLSVLRDVPSMYEDVCVGDVQGAVLAVCVGDAHDPHHFGAVAADIIARRLFLPARGPTPPHAVPRALLVDRNRHHLAIVADLHHLPRVAGVREVELKPHRAALVPQPPQHAPDLFAKAGNPAAHWQLCRLCSVVLLLWCTAHRCLQRVQCLQGLLVPRLRCQRDGDL